MKTFVLAFAAGLALAPGLGCGVEEKDPGALNDADLPDLHIDPVDATNVHVYANTSVVSKKARMHVENVTQGPTGDALADNDGKFDVTLAGALDHVYALRSNTDPVLPVVRLDTGLVVRGYGISFTSATGCWLQGWEAIIREAPEGDVRTRCAVRGAIVGDEETLGGPVEPFVLRRDTVVRVVAAGLAVNGPQARFELHFVNELGEDFTVPVQAQTADGQFGLTEFTVGSVSSALAGRTVEAMEVRAPAGTGLHVADITLLRLDPPEL